ASLAGYEPKRAQELYRNLNQRLAALPGVEHASISSIVPFGMFELSRKVQRAGVHPGPDAKPTTAADGLAFETAGTASGRIIFQPLDCQWFGVARSPKQRRPSPVPRSRLLTKFLQ